MKTLNITLTIKANDYHTADVLGQHELMELVKIIGMRSGSYMASCTGNTEYAADGVYEVNSTVQLDGHGNVNEIIKKAQRVWNGKSEVMNSIIFVSEEQKPEPVQHAKEPETCECYECGQVMVKGYANVINPGTKEEYYLCNACRDKSHDNGDIGTCMNCDEWIHMEDRVRNPVTGEYNICPCCGRIYND